MPNNNDNTTTKLGIDVGQFKRGLQDAQRQIKLANAEFKTASASMDKWSKSADGLQAKIKQLETVLDAENKKLDLQKQRLEEVEREQGKNSAAADEMRIAIANQEAAIAKTQRSLGYFNEQLNTVQKEEEKANSATGQLTKTIDDQQKELDELKQKYANVVIEQGKNSKEAQTLAKEISKLSGDLTTNKQKLSDAEKAADDFDKSISDAGESADKAANGGFTVLKGVLANLASQAIAGVINGLKKVGSEIINVGKQAYSAYASYEQLTGGVETLFGESADTVKKYAENAYKTAGMSANAYMETVTSFSASLLQGLNGDTAKAAKIADKAITDMSDNANKMGTTIESIQNAYQGFAKGNFTMLDNLKLGYGGTKEEMLRLVKEAGVVEESVESIDDVSFDKIIDAIHIVQTNIGITGTTAKEASSTIEGSTSSMKAAWQNLMVSIASENGNFNKDLNTFLGTVETSFKNSGPRIKTIINGVVKTLKSLLRKSAPQLANTVLPVLDKVTKGVKTAGKFIVNNFDKIAPAVMTAVAAFTTFNAVMTITKTVTAVTTAISGLTAGVGLATKAQTIWNAVLSANPIGAVITAVAALTAAVVLLANTQTDAKKAHEEEMAALTEEQEQIESNTQAWNDLKKSQQEQIDAGMTELSYYDTLKKELEQIVDKNGKVKKGYEDRASFITSQLSEATGIEIEQIDGVIQKYDEVVNAIDDVMEKKRAQIILDSQESLYKEAINKQTEALKNLNEMQEAYKTKKGELEAYEKLYAEASEGLLNSKSASEVKYYTWQMDMIKEQIDAKNEELSTVKSSYEQQQDLLSEYAYNIGQYEKNMQLAHNRNYAEMTTTTWNYVKDYQSAGDAQKQMLEDNIAAEETNLNLLKKLKANGNTDIYDQQIKQSEKRLAQQKQELEQYKTTTKEGLDKVKVEWSEGLDAQLSELTGRKVEFKDVGSGMVRMYVDGVSSLNAVSKQEMAKLVTDTINEVSLQYTHAEEAGQDLIDGVNKGIANKRKQDGVFGTIQAFGQNLLEKLKKSLKENSPSKATDEMGQYLLDGLGNGIDKKENGLIKQVSAVGENVLDAFNDELNQNITFDPVRIIKDFAKLFNNLIPGIDISQLLHSSGSNGGQVSGFNLPFGKNKHVINSTANDLKQALNNESGKNNNGGNVTNYNFTQNNTSPKALNRLEIYRQTKNMFNYSTGAN